MYYIKKVVIIKDKIPPVMKNGAKGINFCFCRLPQIIPDTHAMIREIAKSNVPSHIPPTVISFISPIPIGEISLFCPLFLPIFSKIKPIAYDSKYPLVAAIIESAGLLDQGKKTVIIRPINNSGKRYTSGIIRRRQSVTDIFHAQKAPSTNNVKKIMLYKSILIFIFPPCLSIRNYATIISICITRVF